MNSQRPRQPNGFLSSLIGEETKDKRAGLLYSLSACAFFGASFFAMLFMGAIPSENGRLYLNFLVPQLAFALVCVWYFQRTKTPVKRFLSEQKCSPKYYILALCMQIGLLSLSELNAYFLRFLEGFGYQDSGIALPSAQGLGFLGVFLSIALLPAVFEELFFRGILLRDMQGSVWTKVLLCGGLFALYHQNPAQTVYQFACGCCFTLVALRAGSFLPTVLSHFLNNAIVLILYVNGVDSYPTPVYVALLVVEGSCLLGTLAYLIFFDKSNEKGERANFRQFFACASVGLILFGLTWILSLVTGF